jgi:hypothetical protein
MGKWRKERGQGLLELAVILPVLLILLLGIVELGYALRDYLVVVNAAREGCRFAARGRYSDEDIIERTISAGGIVRQGDDSPQDVPFLRTASIGGIASNTAVIVTNIPTDSFGEPISITVSAVGFVADEEGNVHPAKPLHTKVSPAQVIDHHRPVTRDINAAREVGGYERMGNHIVVVEVFFMHDPLWSNLFLPLPPVMNMHARTEMRVVTDRETVE